MEHELEKIDKMLISLEEADKSLELLRNNIMIKNILPTINDAIALESLSKVVYSNYKMACDIVGHNVELNMSMEELEAFSLDNKLRTLTISSEGLVGNIITGIGKAIAAIFKAIFSFIGSILNFFFGGKSNGGNSASSNDLKNTDRVVKNKYNDSLVNTNVPVNVNKNVQVNVADSKKHDKEIMLTKLNVKTGIQMLLSAENFESKYNEYSKNGIDLGDIVYNLNTKFEQELPKGIKFRNTNRTRDIYNNHPLRVYIGLNEPSTFIKFTKEYFEMLKSMFVKLKGDYTENAFTDLVNKSDYSAIIKRVDKLPVTIKNDYFSYLSNRSEFKKHNIISISGTYNSVYIEEKTILKTHLFDIGLLYSIDSTSMHSLLDNAYFDTNPPYDIEETEQLASVAENIKPDIEALIKDIKNLTKSLETDHKKALDDFKNIREDEKLNRQKLLCDSLSNIAGVNRNELNTIAGRLFLLQKTDLINEVPKLIEDVTKNKLKSLNNLLKLLTDLLSGLNINKLPSIITSK
jgi:hypothetical protein